MGFGGPGNGRQAARHEQEPVLMRARRLSAWSALTYYVTAPTDSDDEEQGRRSAPHPLPRRLTVFDHQSPLDLSGDPHGLQPSG